MASLRWLRANHDDDPFNEFAAEMRPKLASEKCSVANVSGDKKSG